ncbi:hypothetical protein R1flu_025716 [Riccia fluitans]|uniref:Uncharacterized protein n=1 Tax=Riccia fluitans TaxID=41844 RepID=A0ABD1XYY9_9MARC
MHYGEIEYNLGKEIHQNVTSQRTVMTYHHGGSGHVTFELPARRAAAAALDRELNAVMEDEKQETDSAVQSSIVDRFQKIRDHWDSYPYVWASYMVVFGGLGIYSAYRWRALRKVENELLKFQEKLKQTMTAEELEQAIKDSQAGKF